MLQAFRRICDCLRDSEELVYDTSEGDCVRICLEEKRNCRSISYDTKTSTCMFSKYTRKTNPSSFITLSGGRYFEKKPDCRPECILGPSPGFRLKSDILKTLNTKNDLECIEACLAMKPSGICLSADRNKLNKICTLHSKTRRSQAAVFAPSIRYIYWDVDCQEDDFEISGDDSGSGSGCESSLCLNDDDICEPGNCNKVQAVDCREENIECEGEITCFKEFEKKHLIFNDIKIFPTTSRELCQSSCLLTPGCKSSEYDKVKAKCYISRESSKTKPFSFRDHGNVIYWERNNVCSSACFLRQFENHFLGGYNWKKLKVKNSLQCMTFCLSNNQCSSADFNKKTNTCFLSKESQLTQRFRLRRNNDYIFWARGCRAEYPCFVALYNRRLLKSDFDSVDGISEKECAKLCMERQCRSINYEFISKTCYLNRFTRLYFPFQYVKAEGIIYMEKKGVCKPDCYYKKIERSTKIEFEGETFNSKSEDTCFEECLNRSEACTTVEFNREENRCRIENKVQKRLTIESQPFSDSTKYIYWTLECPGE
ncbi:DgyrCDS12448 [Dimorphilus gyrociliatus]|uniref:DgyrCDS12448 n=1 Tax=Dimorphilus gyrociliatus TaxID=2664684 RepID=A0A7I8W7A1_9ANNE|nr:DgyrCDS12448 [Dimorphilus gyrociliatus]